MLCEIIFICVAPRQSLGNISDHILFIYSFYHYTRTYWKMEWMLSRKVSASWRVVYRQRLHILASLELIFQQLHLSVEFIRACLPPVQYAHTMEFWRIPHKQELRGIKSWDLRGRVTWFLLTAQLPENLSFNDLLFISVTTIYVYKYTILRVYSHITTSLGLFGHHQVIYF